MRSESEGERKEEAIRLFIKNILPLNFF